ncbi:MAG: NAD-dependent epimerase/dehydratase family protein [Firmicutes bacterium]|nr:NAD-dependent epimerase/dehydratase family protein [Bacillota bacterium]
MKKVYVVIGGDGFVGSNVVRALKSRKETVVVSGGLNGDDLAKLFAVHGSKKVEYVVVHAESVVYLGNDKERVAKMQEVNVEGTRAVIAACVKHRARLVYVSSVHAIPEVPRRGVIAEVEEFNPKKVVGHYAKSMARASQLVVDAVFTDSLDAVIVHPSAIAGPGDLSGTYLTQLIADYQEGRIPAVTSGGFDFVDVRDVAAGIIRVAEVGRRGESYILSGSYYPIKDVLDMLHELGVGKRVKMKLPLWTVRAGLPFVAIGARIKKQEPSYSRYSLHALGAANNFSNEKARSELGFDPRPLRESLIDMVAEGANG